MEFSRTRTVDGAFDDVVETVRDSLIDEGFGVLCDIDVAATFEEKLNLDDYRRYRILGACNPPLAQQGLDAVPDLGVLLPCNVVVYEADDGETVVSAVNPHALLSVVDDERLDEIAVDVDEAFARVLDSVAGASSGPTANR